MHTRRMLLPLLAVCLLLNTQTVHGQNPHPAPPAHPVAPMTDQEVLLLFAGRSANDKMLLTLNNNRPDSVAVDLTAYDIEGNPKQLPTLTLDRSESRLIDLGTTLRSLNVMAPLGFMKVHYSGRSMEVGAQLTLYPVENRGGLDSPRSMSVDFAGTERHAVAWTPPGSRATLAITNVASSVVAAKLTISGKSETLQIQPNETLVRTREAVEETLSPLIDLDVSFTGPTDALRVFGYLASREDGTLPIRAYDPKAATAQVLSAVGLDTGDETHASVRNLSGGPVSVTPVLTPVGTDVSRAITGTAVIVPPLSSAEIALGPYLKELRTEGVQKATLFLKNQAPIGAMIAALDQRIAYGLLEDIPFRTANPPRYMRGAYPLRWDIDYTNTPMIANTSDQENTVRAYVIAGGVTYTFPHITIAAGATALFDVDSIRASQTPDASGNKIPQSAVYGKFHWTTLPSDKLEQGLHGRTELKSLQALRASSFSCGMDCPYQDWAYPYFDTDPFQLYPQPYLQGARQTTLHDYYVDTYGNRSNNAVRTDSMYPDSIDNTSILSMTPINNNLVLRLDTGQTGKTHLNYYFTDNYTYISSTDDGNPGACTVQPGGSSSGGDTFVQTPVQHTYPRSPFNFPCWISSFFDATRTTGAHHAEDVTQSNGGNTHAAPPLGTPVYAMEAGTVRAINTGQAHAPYPACSSVTPRPAGDYARIEGNDHYSTLYFHMNPSVIVGQSVTQGQQIGVLDNSGCQSAPHLHVGRKSPQGNTVNLSIPCVNPLPSSPNGFDDGSINDNDPEDW